MSDLPPLDQPQAYVVVGPNDQRGPYTLALLIDEVVEGRLSDATPVWWPGLADWTTMSASPGVSAEIARRRQPAAPAAGAGYATPAPAPAAPTPAAEPAPAPDPEPEPSVDPNPQWSVGAQPVEPAASYAAPAEDVTAEATDDDLLLEDTIVESAIVEIDDGHILTFAAFVARSGTRASIQGRIDTVHEQLVEAATAGVTSGGFELSERTDESTYTELRFDGADDLVIVSLGRALGRRIEDLRSDHVPLSVSYRGSVTGLDVDAGTGEHGEVLITADEWTGQSTSSVRLFIGLDDYLDERYDVRQGVLADDLAATVAVLRARLS